MVKVGSIKTRVALIGIVMENSDSTSRMNELLSQYGGYIIGRMGIPYREKNISIISIVLDAPENVISALSGKLGMLPGISTKTVYSKIAADTAGDNTRSLKEA